jgi:hypothetical protein
VLTVAAFIRLNFACISFMIVFCTVVPSVCVVVAVAVVVAVVGIGEGEVGRAIGT